MLKGLPSSDAVLDVDNPGRFCFNQYIEDVILHKRLDFQFSAAIHS